MQKTFETIFNNNIIVDNIHFTINIFHFSNKIMLIITLTILLFMWFMLFSERRQYYFHLLNDWVADFLCAWDIIISLKVLEFALRLYKGRRHLILRPNAYSCSLHKTNSLIFMKNVLRRLFRFYLLGTSSTPPVSCVHTSSPLISMPSRTFCAQKIIDIQSLYIHSSFFFFKCVFVKNGSESFSTKLTSKTH